MIVIDETILNQIGDETGIDIKLTNDELIISQEGELDKKVVMDVKDVECFIQAIQAAMRKMADILDFLAERN